MTHCQACGTGELGKGFYVGTLHYMAKAMAFQKGNRLHERGAVVKCRIPSSFLFDPDQTLRLTVKEAHSVQRLTRYNRQEKRNLILYNNFTRPFTGIAVYSPIVFYMNHPPKFHQVKFERNEGEDYVDGLRKELE